MRDNNLQKGYQLSKNVNSCICQLSFKRYSNESNTLDTISPWYPLYFRSFMKNIEEQDSIFSNCYHYRSNVFQELLIAKTRVHKYKEEKMKQSDFEIGFGFVSSDFLNININYFHNNIKNTEYYPEIRTFSTCYCLKDLILSKIFKSYESRIRHTFIKDNRSIIASWSDWFNESPEMTIADTYPSNLTINQNTHLFQCIFFNIVSAITMISQFDISLLAEECSFIDCYRNNHGGAIHFFEGSDCVLHKVCAYQCNTTIGSYGQFCYIQVQSNSHNKSIVHLVSLCNCAHLENTNRYFSFMIYYGNISLNNVNSSFNRCLMYSGFCLQYPTISITTQSTISNNTDSQSRCIGFIYYSHLMSKCNIIGNHQKTTMMGTIYDLGYANLTMTDCVIDINTGAAYVIFSLPGSSVTLHNCYLQSNLPTSGNVYIHSPLSDRHSLHLSHFDSQICFKFIPDVKHDENEMTSHILINDSKSDIIGILTHLIIISLLLLS